VILHSRFEGADVAADIISAGPEPLTSQFAAGYGMVLNLLHTRSLDEARAFLERSFGNYMGEPAAYTCQGVQTVLRSDDVTLQAITQQVSSQQVAGGTFEWCVAHCNCGTCRRRWACTTVAGDPAGRGADCSRQLGAGSALRRHPGAQCIRLLSIVLHNCLRPS
jgi:hypothetical protein